MAPAKKSEALVEAVAKPTAVLNPFRLTLLEVLREPASAAALARKLSTPRQKINYHLRELEKDGFIELAEERRKGNCVERVMRAKVDYYLVQRTDTAKPPEASQSPDKFSATYLIALAARTVRDLSVLRSRTQKAGKRLATFSLQTEVKFRSAADQNAFATDLANEVARLVSIYHDEESPRGRRFRVLVGAYPAITPTASSEIKENT